MVQAVIQGLHESGRLGRFQGAPQLGVVGVGTTALEGGADGPGEEVGLLRHGGDGAPELAGVQVPHIDAVDAHGAVADVEEAGQEVDQRGFARAGGTDQGGGRARSDIQADAAQGAAVCTGVAQGDVVQLDAPAAAARGAASRPLIGAIGRLGQPGGMLRRGDGGLEGHHLLEAPGGDLGARQHADQHHGDHDGEEDLRDVVEVGGQVADGHAAAVHPHAAEPDDRHRGEVHDELDHREHQRHELADAPGGGGEPAVRLLEDLAPLGAADEGPDDTHALDLLAHHEVDAVDAGLLDAEVGQEAAGDEADHRGEERDEHHQQAR